MTNVVLRVVTSVEVILFCLQTTDLNCDPNHILTMEFFGITLYGPQNYIHDLMREEYKEPMSKEEVKPMMNKIEQYTTLPKQVGNYYVYYAYTHVCSLSLLGLTKPTD